MTGRRPIARLLLAVVMASAATAAPSGGTIIGVRAADPSYSVTLTAAADPVLEGTRTTLSASVAPATPGTIVFFGEGIEIARFDISAGQVASISPMIVLGSTTYRADLYLPGSDAVVATATATIQGVPGAPVDVTSDSSTGIDGETTFRLRARVDAIGATGAVTIVDRRPDGSVVVLGSGTIAPDRAGDVVLAISTHLAGIGTHRLQASYGGDATFPAAVSPELSIVVRRDVAVVSSNVGVSSSTVYPYPDGYGDTVTIRGTPLEPLAVLVQVRNGVGTLVRAWSLTSRTSAWSISWNGKTASGSSLAAGTYKVTQRLTDPKGNVKVVASSVVISTKKLAWTSGSITKNALQHSNYGGIGYGGFYACSLSSSCIDIYGGWWYGDAAWLRFDFNLPSAVKYGTLTLAAVGACDGYGDGPAYLSFYSFDAGEEDGIRFAGCSYGTYSTSVSSTGHMEAGTRRVVTWVTATANNGGDWDLVRVTLRYRYAVLK